jgi:transcriptional regulator with XRE-family HTH domain
MPRVDTSPTDPLPPEHDPDGPLALDRRLAERLLQLRGSRGWTLDDMASRSGVSRATLSRLERGETSPTASLLNRLCAAHGLTMSRLLADVEATPVRHVALSAQATWRDPASGFVRRMVSPPSAGFAGEVLAAELPPGATVRYDQASVPGLEHHLVLLVGALEVTLEGQRQPLAPGDSLRYRLWGPSAFHAPGPLAARYLIALYPPT